MKLKLTGLLLLSQAANALTIDKTNYKQHLCDEGLFRPFPVSVITGNINPYTEQSNQNNIASDHYNYCLVRSHYEQAVENAKVATWRTHKPCGLDVKNLIEPSKCVEKQGILYAQACEKLKQDRDTTPSAWNAVAPTLVSCNNR